LKLNLNLKVLLFHWNKIRGKGGSLIAKSLINNRSLIVLDGSFNSLGLSLNNKSAHEFKNMFIENRTLIHLDLSYNSFSESALKILKEGLKENHTILGLHLQGNKAFIDSKGFLNLNKDESPSSMHIFSRIPLNLQRGMRKENPYLKEEMKNFDNCWICE